MSHLTKFLEGNGGWGGGGGRGEVQAYSGSYTGQLRPNKCLFHPHNVRKGDRN